MYPERIHASSPWRSRFSAALPWVFVLGLAAGTMLPMKRWPHWFGPPSRESVDTPSARDAETVWRRAGNPTVRHPVDAMRTIDGDTFEARVHLWPKLDMTTRIRLRGIDAPELKAQCAQELRMAEAASAALGRLLAEGEVTIYNIGPDKYPGRVVAESRPDARRTYQLHCSPAVTRGPTPAAIAMAGVQEARSR